VNRNFNDPAVLCFMHLHDSHVRIYRKWQRGKWRSKSGATYESRNRAKLKTHKKEYSKPRTLKYFSGL